jgi:hypothetical protein
MESRKAVLLLAMVMGWFMGCNNGKPPAQKNKPATDTSIAKADTAVNEFKNEPLDFFLTKASLGSTVQRTQIALLKKKASGNPLTFEYKSGKTVITLIEAPIGNDNFENTSQYFGLKKLYINGIAVKEFIADGVDEKGMVLNDRYDDTLQAYLYTTPVGEFLLFEGDNRTALSHHFRALRVQFLVPFNNPLHIGFLFENLMYVPDGCYLGYQQATKKIVYLDMQSLFPYFDSAEYHYDVFARSIDLEKKTTSPLMDAKGKPYYMKLAVPGCFDNSKYRVIESNWW